MLSKRNETYMIDRKNNKCSVVKKKTLFQFNAQNQTQTYTNNITTYSNTNGYLKTKSAHTLHQKLSHGYVFFWGGCPSRKFIFKGFVSGLQIGDSLRTRPYANI